MEYLVFFLTFMKYLMVTELINWFYYLYIYINIITPRFIYYKNKDTEKIIERIHKLSSCEIVNVLKGCIMYNKETHEYIENSKINIEDLSDNEMINLIGYSLFGIDTEHNLRNNKKFLQIIDVIKKIEEKLGYKFKKSNADRYIYRQWGNSFIKFSFRPISLQIPLRIITTLIHYYFIFKLKFSYHTCNNTKLSYLYKINDPNKETIFFIHGFGFGYLPYVKILFELEKKYNLIIVILPNISSYTYYDDLNYMYFPPLNEIKESIYDFLQNNNLNKIKIVAHSFGTYITQILRKDIRASIFEKIIMVDPIIFWFGCFKMSLHVENPLVRKYPFYQYVIDNFMNFLIYQCIYLKYVCYRIMFGPDFWIYKSSELADSNVIIILEKADYVIPADLLYDKIKNKVNCIYINEDDALHGSLLMDSKYFNRLFEVL